MTLTEITLFSAFYFIILSYLIQYHLVIYWFFSAYHGSYHSSDFVKIYSQFVLIHFFYQKDLEILTQLKHEVPGMSLEGVLKVSWRS